MKAIACTEYGPPDALTLEEIPKPVRSDDEVLENAHAASINHGDWGVLRDKPASPPLLAFLLTVLLVDIPFMLGVMLNKEKKLNGRPEGNTLEEKWS